MRRLFKNQNHADAPYDRPNLPWVCGRAEEGCPCRLGPTAGGRCPESEPCSPVPSLRVRRGRLAIGLALFAAGVLMMVVGSAWRREALAPGALTQAHAQLLTGQLAEGRCAACHPGGVDAALGLAPTDPRHADQSSLCVECHKQLIEPSFARSAHSLPAEVLKPRGAAGGLPIVAAGVANSFASTLGASAAAPGGEIGCAACHQEHHGPEHDLTALSNGRCQACHAERFSSLAADHPDFGHWPYRRRTRINFDHNAHATKHFGVKGEVFDCAGCHADGPSGEMKTTLGYDQACARCHDAGIESSVAGGVAILSLPILDRRAIAEAGARLGEWPEAATGDYDGDLSPMAQLLLANEPGSAEVFARRGAGFSFYDFDPDSPQDAADAAALAEAIRTLVGGLAERGHKEIFDRVERLSCSGSRACRQDLPGGAPVALIDFARRAWFTGGVSATDDRSAIELAGRQTSGGWLLDNRTLALRYVPRGHADPLLRAWIELAASLDETHADLREAALRELAGAKSAGQCAACHSLEHDGAGSFLVNWRAAGGTPRPRGFTRFSHRPHVTQPLLADCAHCHRLDPTADAQASPYVSRRPDEFVVQFQAMSKAACVECHQPKAAGDHCTQCHNYHVDPLSLGAGRANRTIVKTVADP